MRMLDVSWPCFVCTCFLKNSQNILIKFISTYCNWPRYLRHTSAALTRWDCGFESCRGAWMSVCCECCCHVEVCVTGRSLVQGILPCVCVCVCASVSVIRCNNNSLDLQWVGRKWSRQRERKKGRERICNHRPSHVHILLYSLYVLYTWCVVNFCVFIHLEC